MENVLTEGHPTGKGERDWLQPYRSKHEKAVHADYLELTHCPGINTRPKNRIVPVFISLIKKMNGWSMVTSTGEAGMAVVPTITAVAAAASVPASSTAMKDL